jgi:hypothetical protein
MGVVGRGGEMSRIGTLSPSPSPGSRGGCGGEGRGDR